MEIVLIYLVEMLIVLLIGLVQCELKRRLLTYIVRLSYIKQIFTENIVTAPTSKHFKNLIEKFDLSKFLIYPCITSIQLFWDIWIGEL